MSAHTPGPWTVNASDPCVVEREDGDGPLDGFVAMTLPAPELGFDLTVERESNACLIAAAPDLLAACEALVNTAIQGNSGFNAAFVSARAAIAKAVGK